MPVKPRIKFAPGKTYVYNGTEGVYSVIAGELLEGDAVPNGGTVTFGNGAPAGASGKDGDVYFDLTDFKLHTKGSGSWSAGSVFKGANGSNGTAGTNGNRIRWGNGAPTSGLGDNDDLYIDLTDFKLHTKGSGSWGVGSAFKGTNGVKGATLLQGSGLPGSGDGDDGDTFLDVTNHVIYKKSAGSWASQGASFKGTNGSNGSNGATVLQGSSAPSGASGAVGDTFLDVTNHVIYKKTGASTWTSQGASFKGSNGTNGADGTNGVDGKTVHQGSGTPASGTGADGDTFLDTTNHVIYKKAAGSWSAQGTSFKGAAGNDGAAGTDGAGVNKYSSGLASDTYLSTGGTASTATTSGSTLYPATLNLTDVMENVGGVVTRSSVTYNRNGTGATGTGSRFTIASSGRYKLEYFATFNVTASSTSANSVNLNASIYYSTDSGSTWVSLLTQSATFTTASTTTAQTTLELSKTAFLPANTLIEFRASRGTSDVTTVVQVNAIVKSEVGDDTFVVITKL